MAIEHVSGGSSAPLAAGDEVGVVVLCAMRAEAAPIIAGLGLEAGDPPWDERLPMGYWRHPVDDVTLVTNGVDARTGADLIGTTPATLATAAICEHLDPDALLIAGAAGGRSGATEIGRVHMVDRAFHHDRRIPLDGFGEYAIGPEALCHCADVARACGAVISTGSTGNGLDTLAGEMAFFDRHGVVVKDMETASVAWTAGRYGTRVVALRAITDYFDRAQPEEQFVANFDLAVGRLAGVTVPVVAALVAGAMRF